MIPRVIHRVWLGSDPLPDEFAAYGETWRAHHPDWTMELWTDERLPALTDPAVLDRARNHSERSNVIRYELLRTLGGVYVDTDVECLRPIDPLIEGHDAFAAYAVPGRVGSAVVGSAPGHPAMERAADLVGARVGTGKQTNATGPGFLTEVLEEFPEVTIFGPETFYPYSWKERHRAGEEFPEAYAVHHWAKTWQESPDELAKRIEHLQGKVEQMRDERDEARRALAALRASDGHRGSALARVAATVKRRSRAGVPEGRR